MKSYGGNVNTDFQSKRIPKESTSCKYLSLIMLDSFIKVNKKYYSETLLEESKYEIKTTKMENHVNNDFDSSSSSKNLCKKYDNESKNPFKKPDDWECALAIIKV